MEIQFQSTGVNAGFETWLKGFKEISDSLLIEIDTARQQFVAKVFSPGRDIVKYGKLDFSEAGLEVVAVKDKTQKKVTLVEWNTENADNKRIFFPILQQLKKFIDVVSYFSTCENYKLNIKYSEVDANLLVSKAEFKSLAATMYVSSSELTEFNEIITKLTDENFVNRVAAIPNPMTFSVDMDVLKTLIGMSNIYSTDAKKDILSFQTKKDGDNWVLHAIDHTGGTYDVKLAYLNQECENPVETVLPIVRANLITATKNDGDSLTLTLEGVEGAEGKKIRIESGAMFTTIIASVVTE